MSKEYKSYSMELAGRTLRVDVGRVAKQTGQWRRIYSLWRYCDSLHSNSF